MTPAWRAKSLRYRLHRLTARKFAYGVLRLIFRMPFYRLTLLGRRSRTLVARPPDPWPGNAARGNAIMRGEFHLAGTLVRVPRTPWSPGAASEDWFAELHGFNWLRDLRALGGDRARNRATELLREWVTVNRRWRPLAWRADVLANRLYNWLGYAEYALTGADEEVRAQVYASLSDQARHLARVIIVGTSGSDRLLAIKGLICAGACLPGGRRRVERGLRLLETELARQILADGGHIERSPTAQLAALRHLIDIRAMLKETQREVPAFLQSAIDRMAPMLRFFRHGDGGLALFNNSNEDEGWLIDMTLTQADARGKPLDSAPHTGFQRLTANRTLLIVDTGTPAPEAFDAHAHAGTLSFEMSVGKERLIVNCGAYSGNRSDWRRVQRTTAAHSTLTVDDVNSAEIVGDQGLGTRPETVDAERKLADGNNWVNAHHDGYAISLKLQHQRRLYLCADGNDVRGEDTLSGKGSHRFAVRFHLHPTVKASQVQDESSVLLRLAGGSGWRLRATGGVMRLQESIYLGVKGEVRRTEQIVVTGATQNGNAQVRWALGRMSNR